MYKISWHIAFLLFTTSIFAQRIATPPQETIAQAKEIRAEYEDAKLAATSYNQQVRFFLDKKNQKVAAEVNSQQNLMALQGDYQHYVVQFFDETSSISDIEAKDSKGRRERLDVKRNFYEQDGIFYSDAKMCYFPLHFELQGSSYQVALQKNYQDIRYFPSIYFSQPFPVQHAQIQFTIPRDLKIDLAERNFEGYMVDKKSTYDSKEDADVISYTLKKLPPMTKEYGSKGPSHLYPHLLILPKNFQQDGQTVKVFETTKDLYHWYQSLVGLMRNDRTAVADLSKKLTQNATSDEEKIKAIYYWVQDNIRYIAFEDGIAGFKPDECQNVLEKKYGDCKGMANLTKELLIAAGFDARLTWIGTKRLAYDYSTPSLAVDNHMICTIILDDKKYFLDATEEFNEFGQYAERIQGKQVLIEDGDNFILETVPLADFKNNTRNFTQNLTLEEGNLKGTGNYIYTGESKANFLYDLNSIGKGYEEDALRYYITDGDKNYKATNIEVSDIGNRDGQMQLIFDVNWENAAAAFGNEIYLNLDFEKTLDQFDFEDDRKNDYLFSHKMHQVTTVTLDLPEGYSATYLPEPVDIQHDYFSFQIAYTQKDNQLLYTKTIAFPKAEIRKEDFAEWNKAIEAMNKMHNEQVVLTKT